MRTARECARRVTTDGCSWLWYALWLPARQDDVLDELAEIEAEEERERLAAAAARNPGRVATADAGRDILASALDLPSAPTTPILPSAPTGAVLPDAPTGRVAIAADDPDLAELEAMAAGMT